MPEPAQQNSSSADYRQWIVTAEQKSQDDFDKTILSLAAGGLGVSIVFLKDIVGKNPLVWPNVLLCSWGFWAASLLSILLSFFLSHLALRYTITSIDQNTLDFKNPGGSYSTATKWFNGFGAIFFIVGASLMITFAFKNFPTKGASNGEACKADKANETPVASPQAVDGGLHSPATTAAPTPKK